MLLRSLVKLEEPCDAYGLEKPCGLVKPIGLVKPCELVVLALQSLLAL